MWYNIKQNLENGFKMSLSLRYKKVVSTAIGGVNKLLSPKMGQNISRASTAFEGYSPSKMSIENSLNFTATNVSEVSNTTLCLVFQNGKEINSKI